MSEWAEPLPANCPPAEADDPCGRSFYRVANWPPQHSDFDSERIRVPERVFPHESDCIARACSLSDELTCLRRSLKFGKNRGKSIVRITLPSKSGVILKTGGPSHWSWWRER